MKSHSSGKSVTLVPCEEGLPRGHVRGTLMCLHGHLVLLSEECSPIMAILSKVHRKRSSLRSKQGKQCEGIEIRLASKYYSHTHKSKI